MKIPYKLLTKLLLLIIAVSLMISCDKKATQPNLDTTLLLGKQWHLIKVTYNEKGQAVTDNIPACQQDDVIEFKADNTFIRYNGQNKCNQQADQETSQWSVIEDPKTLLFENIEYQIIDLNQTSLTLQRELQGIDGKVIVTYYYIPK